MKSGKFHQEEEEEEDEEFGTKNDATTSANNNKGAELGEYDGKNNDKANAMRSKHSVTEQRRRSKINERFQILRDLIPYSDQKRDTASFLLEVIQYVQFLHEKVQKYEGPYQPWDSEPTKLMPWRNSHWRGQSFAGQAAQGMQTSHQQNQMESDSTRDASFKLVVPQNEFPNKALVMEMPVLGNQATLMTGQQVSESSNHHDELAVEGGTISISSVYSQGLLNSLAQALESTGVDLSQASISVQINLGKRANGRSLAKDHGIAMPSPSNQPIGTFHDSETSEDLEKAHKRLKV